MLLDANERSSQYASPFDGESMPAIKVVTPETPSARHRVVAPQYARAQTRYVVQTVSLRTAHERLRNAARQVPPVQTRVLAGKASGGDAYTWYVSLRGTKRTRFCPLKAGSDAQGAQVRCVLDVRERLWNAAHQVPQPTSRVPRWLCWFRSPILPPCSR